MWRAFTLLERKIRGAGYGCHLRIRLAGYDPKGADKGNAMGILQQSLNIKPEECAAFGDNYNDLEMLSRVKYSYAAGDAKEAVKNACRAETKRVETVLNKIIIKGGYAE